jgi:porin-like protein
MKVKSARIAFLGTAALLLGIPAGAKAQTAPGAGSFPGSILVPGTNTSLKIGGYVKLDYIYDFGVHQDFLANGAGSGALVSAIPLDDNVRGTVPGVGHNIHGVSRLTAAESRVNIETRTPTDFGELKTFIEGDFEGVSGVTPGNTFQTNSDRSAFALRLAYGTLGPFLAGQAAPLFRDPIAEVETLDFEGSTGTAGPLRQPEIRYTFAFANGLSVAGALDNPQSQFFNTVNTSAAGTPFSGQTTFGAGQGDKIPDFVGALVWNQPWGHVALRGVARELYDHGASPVAGQAPGNAATFGWGAGVSGHVITFGKDGIYFQANGGAGIGRYATDSGTAPGDSVISADGKTLKTVKIWDAFLGYQHWWTARLRTNIEGSILQASYPKDLFPAAATATPGGVFGILNRQLLGSHINLIWSPVPAVDLGVEFIYLQRKTEGGQRGSLERGQVSARFRF